MTKKKASFGFTEVDEDKKETLVQSVFSSVADNYDIMNDLMSLGMHRLWKNEFMRTISPQPHEKLLDVAGGTGDIAKRFLDMGGGSAIVTDLNKEMLRNGKEKNPDLPVEWIPANAEKLPFDDESFDVYTISFGIRNVTHIDKALKEAHRVLKKSGRFYCLEFSNVSTPEIAKLYDLYSFKVIPLIGRFVARDQKAYEYLVESIRKFPRAIEFRRMIENAGFSECSFKKLSFGVVAIHVGFKL